MASCADSLALWTDFPKGLRVLLLDRDVSSAAETKRKLQAMDYIVFSYCNEKEASEAICKTSESFHVAIVEVTSSNSHEIFTFLEVAKDLPTIAISDVHCISTMMKCIALGAAEFLQKPLSEEKLRNIWQHVVHKAFSARGNDVTKSLQPVKETVVSILQLESEKKELKIELPAKTETSHKEPEIKPDDDKFPAPSTPQLVKVGRSTDDDSCQDPQSSAGDKGNLDNASAEGTDINLSGSKFVDNTINNLPIVGSCSKEPQGSSHAQDAVEEEVTSDNSSKTDECSSNKDSGQPSSLIHDEDRAKSLEDRKKIKSSPSSLSKTNVNKCSKRKVDWTPELHRRFVQAIEQLGVDQAIPSKILELMKVGGLTRHNVASHLQKYRIHRRHILPKAEGCTKWQPQTAGFPSRSFTQKPVILAHPFHSNFPAPPSQAYPYWGHPTNYYSPGAPVWSPNGLPVWHPPHGHWLWKTPHAMHGDAWGCPIVPPYGQFVVPAQSITQTNLSISLDANGGRRIASEDQYDFNLADEVIDGVVKEAISKPWLPLPLGLKPPSVDAVLAELHRQGVRAIPPAHHSCK